MPVLRTVVAVRSLCVAVAVAAVAIACGSSDSSQFVDPNANLDEAGTGMPPPGTFVPAEAGANEGGPTTCVKKTCADLKADCGPIGDGCGGVVQCGSSCPPGETCGGGGVASTCGKPACTTKTCAQQNLECGKAGDGCGGPLDCGTCEAGICGGGGPSKCGAGGGSDGGACVPTKTTCAVGDCGPIADGCGGLINCPVTCAVAGETCGGGGTPSLCGAPPCVKKTCGTQNCGFIADGCGGSISCWPAGTTTCGPGQSCGGAGVANTCGTPAGCTNLCLQQQACAGGGTTSIEGYVTSPNGVLPVPNAVVYVPNGAVAAFTPGVKCETCATASGNPLISTTTDANGHFFLPNMPVSTAGKVTDIPVVVQLGKWRKQFTIATTACTNNLVPSVGAAAANKTAALPASQAEGDIPLTAISTGQVDGLECVFRKMGVADTEFTNATGTGRIRLYQDPGNGGFSFGGACAPGCGTSCANSGTSTCPSSDTLYCPLGKSGADTCSTACPAGGACAVNEVDKYDAAIFGCTGDQDTKSTTALSNILAYANKGGRVFATHYSYVWLNSATTWKSTASTWTPNTRSWDSTAAPGSLSSIVDTSFPKGVLFSTWLQAPVAPTSATFPPPYSAVNGLYATSPPTVALTEPRMDVDPYACVGGSNAGTLCLPGGNQCKGGGVCTVGKNSGIVATTVVGGVTQPLGQRWLYATDDNGKACAKASDCQSGVCTASKCVGSQVFSSSDPAALDAPMHYTFNTDVTKPAAQQCGRVLYSDFHVSIGNTNNKVFPAECNSNPLTSQEKVLAYFLFDLASCVSSSGPPACAPKSCTAQGLGCGLAGDGCGNQIDCGNCPPGETCGGGGIPSQCGAPACTPKTCQAGQCGLLGDGCGGTLNCGTCAMGTCGGGGANVCGTLMCNPTACPAPAPGSACGPVANGCGGVNNCPCQAGTPCVNGVCTVPNCTPLTCAKVGANCGQVADGCGGVLSCGNCIAPQTCGGGGTANVCGGGVN
jgi:hypothetical protein